LLRAPLLAETGGSGASAKPARSKNPLSPSEESDELDEKRERAEATKRRKIEHETAASIYDETPEGHTVVRSMMEERLKDWEARLAVDGERADDEVADANARQAKMFASHRAEIAAKDAEIARLRQSQGQGASSDDSSGFNRQVTLLQDLKRVVKDGTFQRKIARSLLHPDKLDKNGAPETKKGAERLLAFLKDDLEEPQKQTK
jgi:hypothetical protein